MAGHNGNLLPGELCPQLVPSFARDPVCVLTTSLISVFLSKEGPMIRVIPISYGDLMPGSFVAKRSFFLSVLKKELMPSVILASFFFLLYNEAWKTFNLFRTRLESGQNCEEEFVISCRAVKNMTPLYS